MTNDLIRFYEIVKQKQNKLNEFYLVLENKKPKKQKIVKQMLQIAQLEDSDENRLAVISRLVNLRDDTLTSALKQSGKDNEQIKAIKHDVYEFVKKYHLKIQKKMIKKIERENLLSDFYLALIKGVYEVGKALSDIQPEWQKHIIEGVNEDLEKTYGRSVYEYLQKNHLLEYSSDGEVFDRSYSALVKEEGKYVSKPYVEVFDGFRLVDNELKKLINELKTFEDEEFNQKEAYIKYFKAIKTAFAQNDKSKLISSWQDVDFAWMDITAPIQVGHPLEYYEDHLRKAVALEWDIRLTDVKRASKSSVRDDILIMYSFFNSKLDKKPHIYEKCVKNVDRVGLHIGRPAFYFGSEFNGLFSAQVVPNDEMVSKKCGKKIFAFADNIYESLLAKPFLKIEKEVFGEKFLAKSRDILFNHESLWHEVYEVSTIGHEYGHILWLDENSEAVMNGSGMFKNIEEFKATSGGLVAFFCNEKEHLKEPVMLDLIKRSVGLIAWMKTKEVEPYYCEGLIHLKGLFDSKVLSFQDKLSIDLSSEAYERLKQWYMSTYENLASHYLDKNDAKEFLDIYAKKDENGYFKPVSLEVKYFVNYYWNLHEQIGRIIDKN